MTIIYAIVFSGLAQQAAESSLRLRERRSQPDQGRARLLPAGTALHARPRPEMARQALRQRCKRSDLQLFVGAGQVGGLERQRAGSRSLRAVGVEVGMMADAAGRIRVSQRGRPHLSRWP